MARLGFLYLPWPGHLNPLAGLARELTRRGHDVAFFHLPEFEGDARARGLNFLPLAADLKPRFGEIFQALGELEGLAATRAGMELVAGLGAAVLDTAAPALLEWSPDLLVIDQMDYAASTLAQMLELPFVTAAVTLLKQDEEGIPGFDGLPYCAAKAGPRPPPLQAFLDRLDRVRQRAGLGHFRYETLWSTLAQISQQPPEFEFPRKRLPPWFHFTGPFSSRPDKGSAVVQPVEFPWHRLDGRPLVYASLGTVLNSKARLLEAIVAASVGLGVQLVLSSRVPLLELPEHVLAVPFAPQLEILQRASLMVTHAGMNSALECLSAGVPMVALPLGNDQPGVARRIEMTGTGLSLAPEQRSTEQLRTALRTVLSDHSYRLAAQRMQQRIAEADGLSQAAQIVETVARTGQPVLS